MYYKGVQKRNFFYAYFTLNFPPKQPQNTYENS